jgi:tRNA(Ser,Leu) C12 N-acetylase TAN1
VSWNVVVTLEGPGYRQALKLLSYYGRVRETGFYNVVVLEVEDLGEFMERLRLDRESIGEVKQHLGRALPAQHSFHFEDREEFERAAAQAVRAWLPRLAGKRFYVRLHRRGLKGELSSLDEERALAASLLAALEEQGTPGAISFDDPELVIDLETVGREAGVSLWTREELERYPFLRVD